MAVMQQPPAETRSAKVIRGAAWMYGRMVVTNGLNLVVMAVLARQLSPAEFGLVALAHVVVNLLVLLGSEGVNQFVIHDHAPGWEERLHAAFWLDLTIALTCTALGLALIPMVTRALNTQALAPFLFVLLAFYPVRSLAKVPDALLRKNLEFKAIEVRDAVLEILVGVASIVLVFRGFGAWSIVLPGVGASVLRMVIVYRITAWRPKFRLHLELWPRVFRYYANITGSAVTSYIITDGDTLLIGRTLGNTALGIYNMGWQSANLVNRSVVGLANKLALPSIASVARDRTKAPAVLATIMRVISIVAFPALVGLFVVADRFILVVYGPQWAESVLPLRILILFAMRWSLAPAIGAYFQATGRPEIPFRIGLATVPFYLAGIWIGSDYGIVGVAVAVTAVRTLMGVAGFEMIARSLGVRLRDVLSPLGSPLLASLLMGAIVFAMEVPIDALLPADLLAMLALVFTGVIAYVLLLRSLFHDCARDLARITDPLLGRYRVVANAVLNTR